jgi:hypothetical protein
MFAVLLGVLPASAQTITGTVRGTVTDPSGRVVAGSKVTATDVATGVATSTVTNSTGLYNIQFLPIGTYNISVTARGFDMALVPAFSLEINQIAEIDIKLQVGSISTTVKVDSSTSPIMQTEDATMATTLSSSTLSNMPLNGLNFQSATLFVPGAVDPGLAALSGPEGTERAGVGLDFAQNAPTFNGARGENNSFILDGVEMNETIADLAGYNPAPDAIQQMQIITGNASAEYGNVSGGEVLVVTKGGTNQYHGSAYGYYQSNTMGQANSWANNFADIPLEPYTQSQFGVTVGGPILKGKLFFFGDYLGFRWHTGGEKTGTVATPAMRTGDFSELLSPTYGGVQLYNNQPANGKGYAGATPYNDNQITISNPVAKFLFANSVAYPLPNRAPLPGFLDLDNWTFTSKNWRENNQGDLRIDYKVGPKDSIMGRYTDGDAYDESGPIVSAAAWIPSMDDYPFQNFVASWVHTISNSMVNEARLGVSRTVWRQSIPYDPSGIFGTDGDDKTGIPFPKQAFPGMTEMAFGSDESYPGTTAIVNLIYETNFHYGDDFTWQHGAHVTKFGAQALRYDQNYYYPGNDGALGNFTYGGGYTADPLVGMAGYGFADFLLDQAASASVGTVPGDMGNRQYRLAFYAQDDWKFRHNLTVNLGLRYAYDQPMYEVNNKEATLDLSNPSAGPAAIEYAGVNGNNRALYNPYYWQFMPRVGFAWQIMRRFVLHGGYGITDDLEGSGVGLRMTQNPPFTSLFSYSPVSPTVSSNGGGPMLAENGFTIPSNGTASVALPTNYTAWDPNLRASDVQQYNLALEYLINGSTSAQVAYVGEVGQHLIMYRQDNQWSTPLTGKISPNDCSGTIEPAAPWCTLVGNTGSVFVTGAEAISNYNALQAQLRHRASANGLEYTINYTWSRAMTDFNGGFWGVGAVAEGSGEAQNAHDPMGNYGPAGYDTRQSLNANGVYQLPFGRGRKFGLGHMSNAFGVVDGVLGGWQLSGDAILYTGFPLGMGTPENYNVNGGGALPIHFRPMKIVHRTVQNWFGTDPSAVPCTTLNSDGSTYDNGVCAYGVESELGFGTSRPGTERAPGFRQVDVAAFKTFTIKGSHTLELRGEAFNVGNLASYAPPISSTLTSYTTGTNSTFGRIEGTNSSPRQIQVSMHYGF